MNYNLTVPRFNEDHGGWESIISSSWTGWSSVYHIISFRTKVAE